MVSGGYATPRVTNDCPSVTALQMVRCLGSDTSVTGSHHHNPLEGLGFGEATNTPALPDLPTLPHQEQAAAPQPEFCE